MRKYIYLVLIIFLFCCKNKEKKETRFTKEQIAALSLNSTNILSLETDSITKINLNSFLKTQSFNFDSMLKEVKLIPLETKEKSLLGNIRRVIITKSNIYVHDNFRGGGIVVFDDKGKFIKRIPNGRGPGELVRLYDIDFDKNKDELIAYQHSFLLFYNPSGDFIRQERLPFGFYNFSVIPNGYVFKTLDGRGNDHLGLLKDYTLFVTDKKFKLNAVGLKSQPINPNFVWRHYLHSDNSNLHITQRFTDTIYKYASTTNRLQAKYIIDYSDKKLPERYLQTKGDDFKNIIEKNNYFFNLGQYLDTDTHHIFFLDNWHSVNQTIVYRDKTSGNLKGGTNANYNSKEIPPIAFPKLATGNYFVSWYHPSKDNLFPIQSSHISDEDKQKTKDLTEDDNPVLILYTLKNF